MTGSSNPNTLLQAAQALEDGRTTSRDLVESCLERMDRPGSEAGATFTRIYASEARMAAEAMDQLRRAGRAPSRYAGIPVSIKDLFDVAGEPTAAGSALLRNAPPASTHAAIVQRLLEAGLVLIGRTTMTEFAFSGVGLNPHTGTPRNPWRREAGHIPGGSSSGAAISVTDGFALGAIGTDTGGSCRIPAALCGITGFKPTQRRVPLAGTFALSPTLDSIGPLARSAGCCAALDGILSGEPGRPIRPTGSPAGLRLLIPSNFAFDHLDASTERAFDRAVARLDAAGAVIDRRPLQAIDGMNEAHLRGGFAAPEAYAIHRAWLETSSAVYDPRVASRIMLGAEMSAADYILLQQARARLIRLFDAETEGFDGVMLPTVPIAPPPIAAFADDADYRRLNFLLLRNPAAFNFLDGCAISVPCHEAGAPPAGLMLAAPAMRDARLLAVAASVEGRIAPEA